MSDAHSQPSTPPRLQWRLFGLLCLLGLPGMWVLVDSIIPEWLHSHGLPLDQASSVGLQWLLLASVLVLAVGVGVQLAPRVGLAAPVLTHLVAGRSPREAVRRMWLAGLAGGVAGAAWLFTLGVVWPDSMRAAEPLYTMPLWNKLLYGSLTSELVVRWGMLACVFWGVWRLWGAPQVPSLAMGWLAVVLCAALWALLHVLIAHWLLGGVALGTLLHVMLGRFVFGLLTGFLCWRFGFEAVLLAHALTDLLSHGLLDV